MSVEVDQQRAAGAAALFGDHREVQVASGDWTQLRWYGPFDLLVLDGGGKGKDRTVDSPIDPADGWLSVGGTLVLDDFIPNGQPGSRDHDFARRHWLDHPRLQATEVRLSRTLATIVAVRTH